MAVWKGCSSFLEHSWSAFSTLGAASPFPLSIRGGLPSHSAGACAPVLSASVQMRNVPRPLVLSCHTELVT